MEGPTCVFSFLCQWPLKMRFISIVSIILTSVGLIYCDNADVATVIFSDAESNLNDYMSFVQNNPTFSFPTELISYFTAITTYTDDSYTTILSNFPGSQIASLAKELPWYSSRLETRLAEALTAGVTVVSAQVSESHSTTSTSSSPVNNSVSNDAISVLSAGLSSFSASTAGYSSSITRSSSSSSSSSASSSSTESASNNGAKELGVSTIVVLVGPIVSLFIL